ncbi:hypothetical protein DMENIID0001_084480 [Sergentomyia squamirostris]
MHGLLLRRIFANPGSISCSGMSPQRQQKNVVNPHLKELQYLWFCGLLLAQSNDHPRLGADDEAQMPEPQQHPEGSFQQLIGLN